MPGTTRAKKVKAMHDVEEVAKLIVGVAKSGVPMPTSGPEAWWCGTAVRLAEVVLARSAGRLPRPRNGRKGK